MKRVFMLGAMALLLSFGTGLFVGCDDDSNKKKDPVLEDNQLQSESVTTAPVVDGMVDAMWADVASVSAQVTVPSSASFDALYVGDQYDVTMRSVYTSTDLYMLFEWTGDAGESLERESWYYNTTEGQWMQKPKKHPDAYFPPAYEDKFAVFWNNNITGFETNGCALVCHDPYKYTNNSGEWGDMWHWKRDRTGPVDQLDDKWVQYVAPPGGNGRTNDAKVSGGYSDNKQDIDGWTAPKYWLPNATSEYHWITQTEIDNGTAKLIVAYDTTTGFLTDEDANQIDPADFDGATAAATMPSIYVSSFVGSRGDVTTVHNYAGGKWTLEIQRALDTGNADDVNFTNLTASYYFSFVVFDAAAIAHAAPGPSGVGSPFFMTFEQ